MLELERLCGSELRKRPVYRARGQTRPRRPVQEQFCVRILVTLGYPAAALLLLLLLASTTVTLVSQRNACINQAMQRSLNGIM